MLEERIAVLETEVKALKEDRTVIIAKLDEIKLSLSKYKGFIGGFVFLGSCFYYLALYGKEWLFKKFGG